MATKGLPMSGKELPNDESSTCHHCAHRHDLIEQRVAEQIATMCERWAVAEHVSGGRGATALYLAEKIRSGDWRTS